MRPEGFEAAVQEALAGLDRPTGGGKPPVPPARLAMAPLLPADPGVGDPAAGELTLDAKRWQVVLEGLESDEPVFSQGARFEFRLRLMSTGLDQRWLERTVELARARGGFEAKAVRLAWDSRPLWGHGRGEDPFTLLGHAAHQVIACLAERTRDEVASVPAQLGLTLFEAPSLNAGVDLDGGDAEHKQQARQRLCDEVEVLQPWIGAPRPVEVKQPPWAAAVATRHTLMVQAVEPDPPGGGTRIRQGVAKDRQNSLDDKDRRPGRQSSPQRLDGYNRPLARELDEQLIRAAETLPANTPDPVGVDPRLVAVELQHRDVTSVPIDRGYLGGELSHVYDQAGGVIVCKPWPVRHPPGHVSKRDVQSDWVALQAPCPAGQVIPIAPGKTAPLLTDGCRGWALRAQGTSRERGGRTLTIPPPEQLRQRRSVRPTPVAGRAALRERVAVEHGLAHVSQRQGHRARDNGTRKKTCHLRVVSAIQTLERAQALSEQDRAHEVPHRLAA